MAQPPYSLTQTGGRVYDFDALPNGEQIVYSLVNDQGGIDLWLMGRNGQDAHRLLNCGGDRCTTPAFSPDGQAPGIYPEICRDTPRYSPRRTATLGTGFGNNQNTPVYADPQVIGYGPSWAPAGSLMASWDGINGGIHVIRSANRRETLLPTESGEVGGWSPDGLQMLFTRYEPVGQSYRSFIYRADLTAVKVGTSWEGVRHDSSYGTPAWSPDGAYIAFSLRTNEDSPARSIWIVRPDYLGGPTIGGEPETSYGFYRWDPWGTALVFQRKLTRSEIQKTKSPSTVLPLEKSRCWQKDGSLPQWLP